MSRRAWLCLAGLSLSLSACGPYLRAASTPPPTRGGEHVVHLFDDDELKVGRGVAIAFDCFDAFTGAPCVASSIVVDDPSIARVYPGYLERTKDPWGYEVAPKTAFVLSAGSAGVTTLSVASETGTRTVRVVVE